MVTKANVHLPNNQKHGRLSQRLTKQHIQMQNEYSQKRFEENTDGSLILRTWANMTIKKNSKTAKNAH